MDNNNNNNDDDDNDFNNIHNANTQTFNNIINVLNNTISSYNDNIRSYNSNISLLLTVLNVITENIDISDSSNLFNTINRNRDIRQRFTSARSEPVFRNTHTPDNFAPRRFVPRPSQNIQRPQNITNRIISPRNRNRTDIYNPIIFPRITSIEGTLQPISRFTRETILNDDASNIESLSDLFGNLNLSFQNVPVYPSLNQIQNATRSYNYTLQEFNDNPNEICPITMEEFQINDNVCVIHHCNHIFKKEALYRWFTNNVRCPICRYDIRDFVLNSENETQTHSQSIISNDISNNSQIITDALSNVIGESVRTLLELELQIPLSRNNSDISHNIISP
jgi:hypothetical protein